MADGGETLTYGFERDGLAFAVEIVDLGGGRFDFTISIDAERSIATADIRAVYFDIDADVDAAALSVTDATADNYASGAGDRPVEAAFRIDEGDVSHVESRDTTMNGEVSKKDAFDLGVEFGDPGMAGGDDFQSVSFTLEGADGLSLADFDQQLFGVRLTSVGEEDGARDDSLKISSVIDGNVSPTARDDAAIVGDEPLSFNVLDNDSDPEDGALTVTAVEGGAVGVPVTVTTANGVVTEVTITASGEVIFDQAAVLETLASGETDSFVIDYAANDPEGSVDEATLTVTIEGVATPADAEAAASEVSYNIVFLVDTSGSTAGASLAGEAILSDLEGVAGAIDHDGDGDLDLDMNGDGQFDSELDAQLHMVAEMNKALGAAGFGVDVDVAVYAYDSRLFEGEAGGDPAVRLSDGDRDVFSAGDDLSAALASAQSGGGVAAYNLALAGANAFFAEAVANDGAASVNQVFLLSDGDGFEWTLEGDRGVGEELDALAAFGATVETVALKADGASSPVLVQIETAIGDGEVSVVDDGAALSAYMAGMSGDLIA